MDTFTVRRVISGDTFVIKDKTIGKVKVQIAGITSAISPNGNCDDRFRDILTGLLPEFTTKPDSGIPGYNGASDIQCSTCSWTDIGFVPGQSTQLFGDQDITVATLFDPELVGPDMAEPITG